MRAETEIRDDLAVRPATIMEAATHQAEHGHIHCQCPARLWVEAQDRLARDTGQLLDLHDRDMARVSEALNRAIAERDHAREEWHRQNERADDYRRQLLDETYRPEGVEIVMRELGNVKRERDAAVAEAARVREAPQAVADDLLEGLVEAMRENGDDEHDGYTASIIWRLRQHAPGDCTGCDGLGFLARDDEAMHGFDNGSYEFCAACRGSGRAS